MLRYFPSDARNVLFNYYFNLIALFYSEGKKVESCVGNRINTNKKRHVNDGVIIGWGKRLDMSHVINLWELPMGTERKPFGSWSRLMPSSCCACGIRKKSTFGVVAIARHLF